jgi:F0F1-type ATP synthase assembly protein I
MSDELPPKPATNRREDSTPSDEAATDHAFAELKKRRADEADTAKMYQLSGVGFEFIIVIAACTMIGWWIDKKTGWTPSLTLAGVAIGFGLGLYRLIRFAQRTMK